MRRSYASGYTKTTRREPSLAWFVLGAIVIGVGYIYISGLSDDGGGGEMPGVIGQPGTATGGDTGGKTGDTGDTVRPAVPVIDEGEAKPVSGSPWVSGNQMVFSWIPGGSYMVRTDVGIESKTFAGGFWMAARPVTEAEYEEVTGANPVPEGKRDPSAPVTRINWKEAKDFAVQRTLKERREGELPPNYEYRIPNEMMWEFAAGGGEDGEALRLRDEDSRDLKWWRLKGVREVQDSHREGALRAGQLDVGVVSEWMTDEAKGARVGIKVVRGAPHTAFLGREEEVVKSRYVIYHEDEKLPFIGFRLVMVKTGPDPSAIAGETPVEEPVLSVAEIRPLKPGEEVDYVQRSQSFNLEELFEPSQHSRDSTLSKYNLLRKVQLELKEYGYYKAKVDGYPGRSTQRAIDQFQAVSGLPKSGRLDDATLRTLGVLEGRGNTTGATGTASNTTASRTRVSPMPVPAVPQSPDETSALNGGDVGVTAAPRAVPAYPGNISDLPRAIPARGSGAVPTVSPEEDLRYDGFRGKFRRLGDSFMGVYDPSQDRRR